MGDEGAVMTVTSERARVGTTAAGVGQRAEANDHDVRRRQTGQRLDMFAPPADERDARATREERNVGAEGRRKRDEIEVRALPDRREGAQYGARVARPPTETRGDRDALPHVHERAGITTCGLGHRVHRAIRELATGRCADVRHEAHHESPVRSDAHAIGEVDRGEHAAKLVIAVGAFSGDRQREVDLRRREQRDRARHRRDREPSVGTPSARASATHSSRVSSSARRRGSMPLARSAASARSGVTPAS